MGTPNQSPPKHSESPEQIKQRKDREKRQRDNAKLYGQKVVELREKLERDHFARVCCDNPKDYNRSTKLHRARFRQYLSARYGPFIADKYHNLLNFENPITFEGYQKQIFDMFKDK